MHEKENNIDIIMNMLEKNLPDWLIADSIGISTNEVSIFREKRRINIGKTPNKNAERHRNSLW